MEEVFKGRKKWAEPDSHILLEGSGGTTWRELIIVAGEKIANDTTMSAQFSCQFSLMKTL